MDSYAMVGEKNKKIETVGYLLSLMNNFVKYFFL
jgi:hypothetical protein